MPEKFEQFVLANLGRVASGGHGVIDLAQSPASRLRYFFAVIPETRWAPGVTLQGGDRARSIDAQDH
jgi:hypothetical protein